MKNIEYERLSELIKESIVDSGKENEELIDLLNNNKYREELIENLSSEKIFKENVEMLNDAFARMKTDRLQGKIYQQKRRVYLRKISAVGVSIAAMFILSFYLFTSRVENDVAQYVVKSEKMEYNEPTLVIDEQEIILLNVKKSVVAANVKEKGAVNKQTRQRIIVPAGKIHTVVLEDGSEVILNACSELIYNYPFDSVERNVELKGEAYFKVAKGNRAFIVKSDELSIKVYGTEFNVKSNDKKIETILVEGSIGAKVGENKELMMLHNEMLSYNKSDGNYNVKKVDAATLLQWVDGCFKYVETPLIEVLNDVAKWYNVEFSVGNHIENEKITLFSTRDIEINDMLKLIEQSINTKFIKEGGDKYSVK